MELEDVVPERVAGCDVPALHVPVQAHERDEAIKTLRSKSIVAWVVSRKPLIVLKVGYKLVPTYELLGLPNSLVLDLSLLFNLVEKSV